MRSKEQEVRSKKPPTPLLLQGAGGWAWAAFLILLAACTSKGNKPEQPEKDSSVKFTQYYVQGEELYLQHCSNCHQKNGSGLMLLYPPLDSSDFMDNHFDKVICLMKHGIKGELIVNGKNFNKEMKGIPSLSDLEIAEIATYIYNTWEHQRGLIEVQHVSATLQNCKAN